MAYQIHDVANGDVIQAQTTIDQDTQIAANEQAIEALDQRVDALEDDVGGISQIETDVGNLQTSVGNLQTAVNSKMNAPATEGTAGQVLTTDGQGGVSWNDAMDSAAVENAVGSYINAHPEVIAVADGSITRAKLDMELGEVADTVAEYNDTLKEDVDLTDTTMYFRRLGYIDETGVFRKTSSTTVRHVYIPIICSTPRTIVVEGNADQDTYIAFLSAIATTDGNAVSFAGDYTSRITIAADSVNKFAIPENTTYIYIYLGGEAEAQIPARIYFIQEAKINDYKTIEAVMDGAWATGLDTTMPTQHYWFADGVVTNTGYTRTLAVTPGQHVRITNNTNHSSHHMLLRESLENTGVGNPLNGRPVVYLNTTNNVGRVDDFYVPDGFYYLTVFDHQNGAAVGNRWPTSVNVMKFAASGSSVDIEIDDTLTQQGEAADAKAAGDALATKLAKPATDGTNGQVLTTDGNGGVSWAAVAVDGDTIADSVNDWIEAHPEAVGTVADGSITRAKLDTNVGASVDSVEKMRDDVDALSSLNEEPITFTVGGSGFITYADGNTSASEDFTYTDYIDVSAFVELLVKRIGNTTTSVTSGMAFYDEDRTFVYGFPSLPVQESLGYVEELCRLDIPQGAKYARFTMLADTATYGEFAVYGLTVATDTIKNANKNLNELVLSKYAWINPVNWYDLESRTVGYTMSANGKITEQSDRAYTDFIPVEPGDTLDFFRTDTHGRTYRRGVVCYDRHKNLLPQKGNNSASTQTYTVPSDVYFIRLVISYGGPYAPQVLTRNLTDRINEVTYSNYFAPYIDLSADLLSATTKPIVQSLVEGTLKSTQLANKYACALPRTVACRMTIGIPEDWYYCNAFNLACTCGSVGIGAEYCTQMDGYLHMPNTNTVNATNGFGWTYYDPFLNVIERSTGRSRKIREESLSDCSLLAIGDSTIDQDVVTRSIRAHFVAQGHTITLLGTQTDPYDPDNHHEGRAGWTTVDYFNAEKAGRTNPFYNPDTQTFDFTYYMTNQGYTAPDFVLIQLGINDISSGGAEAIVPTYNNICTMINSVRAYSTSIKIILNLPTPLNADQSQVGSLLPVAVSNRIQYNEYVQTHIINDYTTSQVRVSYCHLILNPATEIRDNTHPTNDGYTKMGLEVCNQINHWQNGY